MQDLKKQNHLLKQYIKSLEHQNQSKNRQRIIMQKRIDHLIKQIQSYQSFHKNYNQQSQMIKLKKHLQKIENQKIILYDNYQQLKQLPHLLHQKENQITKYINQINQLKKDNYHYQKQLQSIQNKNNLHRELENYQNQLEYFKKQKLQLKQINQKIIHQNNKITMMYHDQIAKKNYQIQQLKVQINTHRKSFENSKGNQQTHRIADKGNDKLKHLQNQNKILNQLLTSQAQQLKKTQQLCNQINKESIQLENKQRQKYLQQIVNKDKQINYLIRQLSYYQRQKNNYGILKRNNSSDINILDKSKQKQQYQKRFNTQNSINNMQQICYLTSKIQNLQTQIQQKNQTLKKQAESLDQLQKGILELQQQRNNQNNKYKNIIELKNNQIYNLSQSYNHKITQLNLELQKNKEFMENMKLLNQNNSQIKRLKIKVKQLQNQRQKYQTEIQQNQALLASLQRQNQTLKHTNESYLIRIKQLQQQPKGYYQNSRNTYTQKNRVATYQNESQTKQQMLYLKNQLEKVKKSNKNIEKQNHQMRVIIENQQSNNYKQFHYNTPNHLRTLGETRDYHLNQNTGLKLVINNSKENISANKRPIGYKAGIDLTPKQFIDQPPQSTKNKVYVRKTTVKPVSQTKQRQDVRFTPPAYQNTYSRNTEKVHQKISHNHQPSGQKQHFLKENWDSIQQKINYLRSQNKQLKRTLFQ